MRSSNPALQDERFGPLTASVRRSGHVMTVSGTVNRTAILLGCVLLASTWTWVLFYTGHRALLDLYLLVGALGGLALAVITTFRQKWAAITAPIYAVLEGLCLGALSAHLEAQFPGVAIEAVALTMATSFCLLLGYRIGFIRPTSGSKRVIILATGGVALFYVSNICLGVLNLHGPSLIAGGPFAWIIQLVIVIVAALNLIMDFDFIEQGASNGAPKYLEWYAAFGLVMTLVWLYLEMLKMLSKSRQRQ